MSSLQGGGRRIKHRKWNDTKQQSSVVMCLAGHACLLLTFGPFPALSPDSPACTNQPCASGAPCPHTIPIVVSDALSSIGARALWQQTDGSGGDSLNPLAGDGV